MKNVKKVTAHLPKDLLQRAQRFTGEGVTETIRQGLEAISAQEASQDLRKLRGKVKVSIDLKELREDD